MVPHQSRPLPPPPIIVFCQSLTDADRPSLLPSAAHVKLVRADIVDGPLVRDVPVYV